MYVFLVIIERLSPNPSAQHKPAQHKPEAEVLVGGQRAKRAREPPRAVSPLRTAKRACEPRVNFHRLLAARNGAREHDEQPAR